MESARYCAPFMCRRGRNGKEEKDKEGGANISFIGPDVLHGRENIERTCVPPQVAILGGTINVYAEANIFFVVAKKKERNDGAFCDTFSASSEQHSNRGVQLKSPPNIRDSHKLSGFPERVWMG